MLPGVAAVSIDKYCNIQRFTLLAGYDNKILTSTRNGDLIMWDLNKAGSAKYGTCVCLVSGAISQALLERKTKDHIRSIHKLSCSSIVPYYCVTGSADGDMRVWVRTCHALAFSAAYSYRRIFET